jgi:hypothetical protein
MHTIYSGTCHGSGGYSPVSDRRGPGSTLDKSMWDMSWIYWQWDMPSPRNSIFCCSIFPLALNAHISPTYHQRSIILALDSIVKCGPGSSSRYRDWLRAGRSGDRIPVEARFFAHVQTGPGAHPASCTTGTGSFPGVKRPGRGADHPHPSSAEVKKE